MAHPGSHICLARTGAHKQYYWPRLLVKLHEPLAQHSTGGGQLTLPTPHLSSWVWARGHVGRAAPQNC